MTYFSGYLYTQHRVTEERHTFHCEDRTCKSIYKFLIPMILLFSMLFFGRLHTYVDMNEFIKELSEHSHVPDANRLDIIRVKNEIKIRGASSDEGASAILSDVFIQLHWLSLLVYLQPKHYYQQFVMNENQYNLIIMVVCLLCCEKLIVVKISFCMQMIQWLFSHAKRIYQSYRNVNTGLWMELSAYVHYFFNLL